MAGRATAAANYYSILCGIVNAFEVPAARRRQAAHVATSDKIDFPFLGQMVDRSLEAWYSYTT
jgi:hypothetical protein